MPAIWWAGGLVREDPPPSGGALRQRSDLLYARTAVQSPRENPAALSIRLYEAHQQASRRRQAIQPLWRLIVSKMDGRPADCCSRRNRLSSRPQKCIPAHPRSERDDRPGLPRGTRAFHPGRIAASQSRKLRLEVLSSVIAHPGVCAARQHKHVPVVHTSPTEKLRT